MTYYAGFWRRMGAAAIDLTLGLVFAGVVFSWFPESFWDDHPGAGGVVAIVYLSIWFNYFALAEWRWGQTFGKIATRIKVVTEDGKDLTWGQASIRNLLRLVDLLGIGFLLIAFADTRQRLGDRAGRTIVVPQPPKPESRVDDPAGRLASAPPPDPNTIVPVSPAPASPGEELPQITWTLGQTVGWFFGGLLLAVFAPLLVLPFDPELKTTAATLVAQGLFGAALVTVALGVASGWDRSRIGESLRRLGLRRFKPSALGWMLLLLFGYYVAVAIFSSLVVQPEQEDISGELGVGDENVIVAITAVLLIGVLAPISEELFFRGFLFAGLRQRLSLWPAVVISGLLFGLVHAPSGITTVIPLAMLGMLLAWFYAWNGSLWPCVFMHMVNNGLALAVTATVVF
jgi:membrane protease YdiL (CAAX protease family)/uncharacterized RDD family membrane protein YckC